MRVWAFDQGDRGAAPTGLTIFYRVELTGGQPTSGLLRNLNGQAGASYGALNASACGGRTVRLRRDVPSNAGRPLAGGLTLPAGGVRSPLHGVARAILFEWPSSRSSGGRNFSRRDDQWFLRAGDISHRHQPVRGNLG